MNNKANRSESMTGADLATKERRSDQDRKSELNILQFPRN